MRKSVERTWDAEAVCPPLLGRRKREAAPRRRECAHMAPNPLAAPTAPCHWPLAAYPLEGRGSHPVTSPLLTAFIKGLYASAFCTALPPPLLQQQQQPRLKLIGARVCLAKMISPKVAAALGRRRRAAGGGSILFLRALAEFNKTPASEFGRKGFCGWLAGAQLCMLQSGAHPLRHRTLASLVFSSSAKKNHSGKFSMRTVPGSFFRSKAKFEWQ